MRLTAGRAHDPWMRILPPFRYVGGKTQLLPEILPRLPDRIGTYFEPFIGGGAVFFALASERRFERAVIADANPDIVEAYVALRDDFPELEMVLREHETKHSEEHYYALRNEGPLFRSTWSRAERAGRTMYLAQSGFNGLQRRNLLGEVNVSWGKRETPAFDFDNLAACSVALAGVDIRCSDFAETVAGAGVGDAVYADCPYLYPPDADNFTAYTGVRFGRPDHVRLADLSVELGQRGVSVLLSNDDNATVREVYAGLHLETVYARRNVNRDGEGRGPVPEILATYRG